MKPKRMEFSNDIFTVHDEKTMWVTQESKPQESDLVLDRREAALLAAHIVFCMQSSTPASFESERLPVKSGGLKLKVALTAGPPSTETRHIGPIPWKELPRLLSVTGEYLQGSDSPTLGLYDENGIRTSLAVVRDGSPLAERDREIKELLRAALARLE